MIPDSSDEKFDDGRYSINLIYCVYIINSQYSSTTQVLARFI